MRLKTLRDIPSHAMMIGFALIFITYIDLYLEDRGRLPVPVLAVNLLLYAMAALAAWTFGCGAGVCVRPA